MQDCNAGAVAVCCQLARAHQPSGRSKSWNRSSSKFAPPKAVQMPKISFVSKRRCTAVLRPATVFDLVVVEDQAGMLILQVSGKGVQAAFAHETGGHRFQRIPPSEKRGRVQTSTITVACLPVPDAATALCIADRDLEWKFCRSGGSGGQHVNRTDSAAIVKHLPSGLQVRCESERSQLQNKAQALAVLQARLAAQQGAGLATGRNDARKAMIGVGARGDKEITLRQRDDTVTHHGTGKRTTWTRYMRGYIEYLA